MNKIYTIGYSPHTPESFLNLLRQHRITAVVDVRSTPYSAHRPEFNMEQLRSFLKENGVQYVFMGDMLGARFEDDSVYIDGVANYNLIAKHDNFLSGIERLKKGSLKYSIALMCAEKDPITCHRTILISRNLKEYFDVYHILANGDLEAQQKIENRLINMFSLDQVALPGINDETSTLDQAYKRQEEVIAYRLEDPQNEDVYE